MRQSTRLLAAARLAIERNAAFLDSVSGLSELRIDIKIDREGFPCKAIVFPQFEMRLVTKSLDSFTFEAT